MPSPNRSPRNERRANCCSFDTSQPPADETGDLIWPKTEPARLATSAELLTPEQFQAALERGRVHSKSLWDAVVKRPPRGYIQDGEAYRPAGKPPEGFVARRAVAIPAWAKVVALVVNGIDGWPPMPDARYSVEEFIQASDGLQQRPGGGEWDVLVYAMDADDAGVTVRPYGLDNPYRRPRSARGHRAQQVARFSYMRWHWYDFATPSLAALRLVKAPAQESEARMRSARR